MLSWCNVNNFPNFFRIRFFYIEFSATNQRFYDLEAISEFLVELGEKAEFTKFAFRITMILAAGEGLEREYS